MTLDLVILDPILEHQGVFSPPPNDSKPIQNVFYISTDYSYDFRIDSDFLYMENAVKNSIPKFFI